MTELTSRELDHGLAWYQRPGRWLHLAGCAMCRRYRSHWRCLRRVIRNVPMDQEIDRTLPPDARDRLKERLRAVADGGAKPNGSESLHTPLLPPPT